MGTEGLLHHAVRLSCGPQSVGRLLDRPEGRILLTARRVGDVRTSLLAYRIVHAGLYPPGWRDLERKTKRAHPWCSFCGQREDPSHKIILQVHHIVPIHVEQGRALDPTNLVVLCSWDHLHEGHVGDFLDWDSLIVGCSSNNLAAVNLARASTGPSVKDRRPLP